MSLKNIDKNIATIVTTANKLNELVHETAMMIVLHAAPKAVGGEGHGDCSRAQTLVMALPASFRRTMLIQWFATFTPIVTKNTDEWNAQMQKEKTATGKTNPLYVPWNIEAARELPFWKMAQQNREADFKPLHFSDLVKAVEDMAKRIEKQIDDGKIAEEDAASAVEIVKTLEGLHFTRIKAKAEKASSNDTDEELAELREKYQETFGKKPYHGWSVEDLTAKLAEDAKTGERAAA